MNDFATYIMYPNMCFHELGHYLAVKTLFSDANPRIQLLKARVLYHPNAQLTKIGRLFQKKICNGIIAAAGPTFDLINIAISSVCGYRASSPIASYIFKTHALLTAAKMVDYAYSKPRKGHDYQDISKFLKIPLSYLKAGTISLQITTIISFISTIFKY